MDIALVHEGRAGLRQERVNPPRNAAVGGAMRLRTATSLLLAPLALVLVSLAASVAHAQSPSCQSVRRTRVLARANGLDGANLAALERIACGGPLDLRGLFVVPRPSEDCVRITTMHALAAAAGSEDAAEIDGTRVAVCRAGNLGELDEWPSGRRIHAGSTWYYPSGARFSSVGRTFLYPNGRAARGSDGAWRYPNGVVVDPDTRRFHTPDGASVESERELLAWICARVGAERCEGVLDDFPAAWGEVHGAIVTMLGWEARRTDD
jgi:hypothetical protein